MLQSQSDTYAAFLRGINVNGRHKVPMEELKSLFLKTGFTAVHTFLNTGNVLFTSKALVDEKQLENELEKHFGFPIPLIIISAEELLLCVKENPFDNKSVLKGLKFNISFLKKAPTEVKLPISEDTGSIQILACGKNFVYSQVDTNVNKTVKLMALLEKNYGKNITTRNLNTIQKMTVKLKT